MWSRSACNSGWKQIREVVYGLAVGCRENVHVKQFGGRNGAVTKPQAGGKPAKTPIHPDVAQSGSARALGAWGRRFESCRPDHYIEASLNGMTWDFDSQIAWFESSSLSHYADVVEWQTRQI